MLCSAVKHTESGYSTKEMYGEARADRLKHQTTRKYLDRKFESYEKNNSIFSVSLSHKKTKKKKKASE